MMNLYMSQLFTKTDFTTYMQGKALSDSLANSVTKAVNAYVENKTNRCWGDTNSITETHNGYKRTIWLRHQDVRAVASVVFLYPGTTDYIISTNAYWWDELGRLSFYPYGLNMSDSYYGSILRIKVTYSYGVDEVPEDLKLAALGIAAGMYNWASNSQKEVVSASVGSYRLEYSGRFKGGSGNAAQNTADANWAVIDSYRMRRG